jgi:hypothetical protein
MKSKKTKHNKKRNTAFLYEILVRQITKSIVNGESDKKRTAIKLCREFFHKGTPMAIEKRIYDSVLSLGDVSTDISEKVMEEAKKDYDKLDKKEIFNEQTKLINKINKELSQDTYQIFIQNYKDLATVAQILNQELPVKERVLLENEYTKKRTLNEKEEMAPTDSLVYKMFVKSFNEKYGSLLHEQKELITRHALSFSDNGLALKVFLSEELRRLKEAVQESKAFPYIKEDSAMSKRMDSVYGILESFREKEEVDSESISKLLEIQDLVRELKENDSNAIND